MRWMPLIFIVSFMVLAFIFPLIRLRLRHGRWGIVRSQDPVQQVMVKALILAIGGAALWGVLMALLGPESLGVWIVPPWVRAVGVVLGVMGLALVVIAQNQMGKAWRVGIANEATPLIRIGLFRHIRHPIYTGIFALVGALNLLSPSPWVLMGGFWLLSLIMVQARLEEGALAKSHGRDFYPWAAKTGRFFPGIGRYAGIANAQD